MPHSATRGPSPGPQARPSRRPRKSCLAPGRSNSPDRAADTAPARRAAPLVASPRRSGRDGERGRRKGDRKARHATPPRQVADGLPRGVRRQSFHRRFVRSAGPQILEDAHHDRSAKASATQIAAIAFDVTPSASPGPSAASPWSPRPTLAEPANAGSGDPLCAARAASDSRRAAAANLLRPTGNSRRRPGDNPLRRALSGERALDEMRRRERQRVAPEGGDDLDADRQPGGVS